MLRSDREVALNDLLEAADAAARQYEQAAETSRHVELAALFAELAPTRRLLERRLTERIRGLGALPHAPDPDREAARQVVARLRAALSPDEERTLIEECEEADRRLAERMAEALALGPAAEQAEAIRRWQSDLTAALGRLAAAKARL